jgi:hypothetical protein
MTQRLYHEETFPVEVVVFCMGEIVRISDLYLTCKVSALGTVLVYSSQALRKKHEKLRYLWNLIISSMSDLGSVHDS